MEETVDVAATFIVVVPVPKDYTTKDVQDAVEEYLHSTDSFPEPVHMEVC